MKMTNTEIIKENLTKASHDVQFLRKDLTDVYKEATENNALTILVMQLLEKAGEIERVLEQLEAGMK
jgi:hypothetical protein